MAAQVVPDEIAQQASGNPQQDGQREIHLAGPGQRSGGQQHRDRRNRQPHLLGKDYGKEQAAAVPDQKLRHVIHGSPHRRSGLIGLRTAAGSFFQTSGLASTYSSTSLPSG